MALGNSTAKLSELPLSVGTSYLCTTASHSYQLSILRPFCVSATYPTHSQPKPSNKVTSSDSWLTKWPPANPNSSRFPNPKPSPRFPQPAADDLFDPDDSHFLRNDNNPCNAIDRVVIRLRNLRLASYNDDNVEAPGGLSRLLRRDWVRSDTALAEDEANDMLLPWDRDGEDEKEAVEIENKVMQKRKVKPPTLAELNLEEEERARLRRLGMQLKEKVNVAKAGLTQAVLDKIHDQWRKKEVVRLKFHELLARDMKTAHEIVERRTRGLVIWRSGSVMLVFRGKNYEGPTPASLERSEPVMMNQEQLANMTPEEEEFDRMLGGLGPRFVEWWGTGIVPIDADLLPPTVPGYKTPLRLLPTGMPPRLTDAELTNMRKLSKALPCHFALGRNRNLQGLAVAILKLWEKSLVVKIAVKRGILNTNNELMAGELKKLTGGTLLIRNKYFIVIYRGKDFVPTSVAAVLAERQEMTKQVVDDEEKARHRAIDVTQSGTDEATTQAGSLAEFYEAQTRWGKDISAEEREKMIKESAKAKNVKLFRKVERKLVLAKTKKIRAENLLSKVEASLVPADPDCDQETISEEERAMFRRVGLIMKPYLPLGIRGVFDGVIENMHLHWRHRELVKLITKQKTFAFVEDTARLLEYESGGILVSIDRLPKGFCLIYYRGKNYRRPVTIKPRNLLTKAKALKRSIAMQRHEALSKHITELGRKIEEMKEELGLSHDLEPEDRGGIEDLNQIDHVRIHPGKTPSKIYSFLVSLKIRTGNKMTVILAMRKMVAGILRIRSLETLKMMTILGWQVYRVAVKFLDDMPLHAARRRVELGIKSAYMLNKIAAFRFIQFSRETCLRNPSPIEISLLSYFLILRYCLLSLSLSLFVNYYLAICKYPI
ncbi:hypothetical protein Ahy_B08g089826 isoform B [Arachis hypogaea]|uniref:CRM domain-containing protein n=1 Tax=Arachis hypogaea TaxID=3818 RepID=A0A444XYX8_ARAHY|nr:hypothetical protein Ahy_B08g089826 isoform B [Arachis hypogaea]